MLKAIIFHTKLLVILYFGMCSLDSVTRTVNQQAVLPQSVQVSSENLKTKTKNVEGTPLPKEHPSDTPGSSSSSSLQGGAESEVNQLQQTSSNVEQHKHSAETAFLTPSVPHHPNPTVAQLENPDVTNFELLQGFLNHSIEDSTGLSNQQKLTSEDDWPTQETANAAGNPPNQNLLALLNLPQNDIRPEQLGQIRQKMQRSLPQIEAFMTHFVKVFGSLEMVKMVRNAIRKAGDSPELDSVLNTAGEAAKSVPSDTTPNSSFQIPALPFDPDLDISAIRTSFYYSTTKDNVIACGLPESWSEHGHVDWKKEAYKNFNWELCTHLFVPATVAQDKDKKIGVAEHFANLIAEAKQKSKSLKVIISLSFSEEQEKDLIEVSNSGKENAYVKTWVMWLSRNELQGKKEHSVNSKNTNIQLDGFQIPLFRNHVAKTTQEVFTSLFKAFHRELDVIRKDNKEVENNMRKKFQLFAKLVPSYKFEGMDRTVESLAGIIDYFYYDTSRLFPYSYEHNEKNLISAVAKLKRFLKRDFDKQKFTAKKIVLGLPLKAMELKEKLKTGHNPTTAENLLVMLKSLDTKTLKDIVASENGREKTIHYAAYNDLHTQEYHPHFKIDQANKLLFLGNDKEELENKIHYIILRGLGGAFLNLEHARDTEFPIFHKGFVEIASILNKRFFGKIYEPSNLCFKKQEPNDWVTGEKESKACFRSFSSNKHNKQCSIFKVKITDYLKGKEKRVTRKLAYYLPELQNMLPGEKIKKAEFFLKKQMPQVVKTRLNANQAKSIQSKLEKAGAVCEVM